MTSVSESAWRKLADQLAGEVRRDTTARALYATDASVYREIPLGVAFPYHEADVRVLVAFAAEHGITLIPRTAGTSLAGQVVGSGLIVDVSRHFTRIGEINPAAGTVRVQPGVVRNELNLVLAAHGLHFAPETSTQNRAMVGGMVGNNSCGANSVIYGSVRDHLQAARAVLSDGSVAEFRDVTGEEFFEKQKGDSLEASLYRQAGEILRDAENRAEIARHFPKPSIHRRNSGYAIDMLAACEPFSPGGPAFNFCRLLAGSEGTLAFLTELTLRCVPLPPRESALVCIHCASIDEALRANLVALRHAPRSCELLDRTILDCTKANLEQRRNRVFLVGEPEAILAVELAAETREEVGALADAMQADLLQAGLGRHFPIVWGPDQARVWNLRKAALGLLANLPGDPKPVAVIEDAAVDPLDLPSFIRDFGEILQTHGLESVHYGHAASGELHLRPILNLKLAEHQRLFRMIATDVAHLVKRYGGSLSGEHGDGRLRGEFLPLMLGERNYAHCLAIKAAWDPRGVFNRGKITSTPPMDAHLRYAPGQMTRALDTVFDFSSTGGFLRAAEKCNGSGDCRKSHLMGGTMCPSYMATRREEDTTRARANILREVLTHSTSGNPLGSDDIKEVMDLCLSCKACKSECPSNVDVSRLKAEFLQHFYDARGVPLRTRLVSHFATISSMAGRVPWLWNAVVGCEPLRRLTNRLAGFHPDRTMPRLHAVTLRRWWARREPSRLPEEAPRVWLFCDEFTNHNDVPAGIAAVELLEALGYRVRLADHAESGRSSLSQGLSRRARTFARENVRIFSPLVTADEPLVGVEPSAILSFRDEYPDLVGPEWTAAARALTPHCLTLEEFLVREQEAGRLDRNRFDETPRTIKLHGHCFQKALTGVAATVRALEIPRGHRVQTIPSGCCGMAGAFGYEHEHYRLSMEIGGLVLFPAIRDTPAETLLAAPGTSCRHQIHDGTGRTALHPAEILRSALRPQG